MYNANHCTWDKSGNFQFVQWVMNEWMNVMEFIVTCDECQDSMNVCYQKPMVVSLQPQWLCADLNDCVLLKKCAMWVLRMRNRIEWDGKRGQAPSDGVKPSQFCKRRGCLPSTENRPTKTTKVLRTTRHYRHRTNRIVLFVIPSVWYCFVPDWEVRLPKASFKPIFHFIFIFISFHTIVYVGTQSLKLQWDSFVTHCTNLWSPLLLDIETHMPFNMLSRVIRLRSSNISPVHRRLQTQNCHFAGFSTF